MIPSDSGRSRAASGGAFERRNTATANRATTVAKIQSVLRVRLRMLARQKYRIIPGSGPCQSSTGEAGPLKETAPSLEPANSPTCCPRAAGANSPKGSTVLRLFVGMLQLPRRDESCFFLGHDFTGCGKTRPGGRPGL